MKLQTLAKKALAPLASFAVSSLVLSAVTLYAAPLVGDHMRDAAAQFQQDLAAYRAAPPELRGAPLVSAAAAGYEDRGFFKRSKWTPPISLTGLGRAVWRNLHGVAEGGSTIPQQVAKLYLRGARRGHLGDKVSEALFATWLVRQASPDELAGLYLNLSAGMMGRQPVDGLNRLSLALFGLPLRRLSREDQLVLGASPRGVQWLREHPQLSAGRVAATRDWLIAQKLWDPRVPSYLDGNVDAAAAFGFVDGWTERVASGNAADLDLVSAIDAFRDGLDRALDRDFPGTSVRAAFAAIGADGAVLARSGAEAALMPVNYGSIAKLEALDFAVEAFGPEAVRDMPLAPEKCIRWIWATKAARMNKPSSWCPEDVAPPTHAMSFDEAVARSVNTLTARHALMLPALLYQRRPDLLQELSAEVPREERAALDSPADRALGGAQLAQLGTAVAPDEVAPELSYSAAGIGLFRLLRERREAAGLPAGRLPEDPTSLLGNSSRATAEQIGGYLERKLFQHDRSCFLSDTGTLLAERRKDGTLRWLAARWPRLIFAGKTGSSPHDDSAVAAIAVCLDNRPVVLIGALRAVSAPLPKGLQGSTVLRGLDGYLHELQRLGRAPTSVSLPEWAAPPPAEPTEALPETTVTATEPAEVHL